MARRLLPKPIHAKEEKNSPSSANQGLSIAMTKCGLHPTHLLLSLLTQNPLGMGNISILSNIVILRAHDNCIVVVLQLSSYRLHIISGAFA